MFLPSRALPDIDSIDQTWKRIQDPLFELLRNENVVYTRAQGGNWLKVQEAVFDRLDDEDPKELLERLLLEARQNIVTVPKHVFESIRFYTPNTEEITPSFVRRVLKETPSCYRSLNRIEKLRLLKYVQRDDMFTELLDLELLPICDGNFVPFANSADGAIYVTSSDHPPELLPGLRHRLLAQDLDEKTLRKLEDVAEKGMNLIKRTKVLARKSFVAKRYSAVY